jgi:hypothetical protein
MGGVSSIPAWPQFRPHANGSTLKTEADTDAAPAGIDELCETFASVCESAVDPLEIASALEFDGLNDQAARDRYGLRDVFTLAEIMYLRVPRRPAEPEPGEDPWRLGTAAPALHAVLYGLPAACFPAVSGLIGVRGSLTVLIVALLASWSLSQSVAYLGYTRLNQGGQARAAWLLLAGMVTGTVVVAGAMAVTGLVTGARAGALIFGVGLGGYMLGATVLLILKAERLVLIALAPGVLASVAFMAAGRPQGAEHAAWAGLAATPLLALGLAVVLTVRQSGISVRRRGIGAPTGPRLGGVGVPELRGAAVAAAFGLVAAALLVFPIAAASVRGTLDTGVLLASLPLSLSMGAAEWMLVWFRRRSRDALTQTLDPRVFATRARLALAAALAGYLAIAVMLAAAVTAIAVGSGLVHLTPSVFPQAGAYLTLGGAMFIALLLQAFGSRVFPVLACLFALGLEFAARRFGDWGQLAVAAELLTVLTICASRVVARAVRHV